MKPLKDLIESKDKDMKIPVWEYNGKYYLKINDKKLMNTRLINIIKSKQMTSNYLYLNLTFHILWT